MTEIDVDSGIAGATVPTETLSGPDESSYVKTVTGVMRAARLNNQYPDSRKLGSHLSALAPELHHGLYPGVQVDIRSGLPSYKEWTRVQTDVRIAPDQLRQLGDKRQLEAKAKRGGASSIHAKQFNKHQYYSALTRVQLTPLGDMHVALRRLDAGEHRAHFHVVLDKLDVSGFFVRYSIDLAQTDDFWTESIVTLNDEAARHTEGFRSLVYQFTSYDAEFTFVKLASISNLTVERVIKGVVGPFCFPFTQNPPAIQQLLQQAGGNGVESFVAMFALDMAATDISADRDNDPFEDLIIQRLSPEARQGYIQARERWGYRVFKDRKFVCSRQLVEPLRGICTADGTKNIIYPV